jgi:hypothetical protein
MCIFVCYLLCTMFERKLTRVTYILLLAAYKSYSKTYFNIKTNHQLKKETKNRNQKKKKKEGPYQPGLNDRPRGQAWRPLLVPVVLINQPLVPGTQPGLKELPNREYRSILY